MAPRFRLTPTLGVSNKKGKQTVMFNYADAVTELARINDTIMFGWGLIAVAAPLILLAPMKTLHKTLRVGGPILAVVGTAGGGFIVYEGQQAPHETLLTETFTHLEADLTASGEYAAVTFDAGDTARQQVEWLQHATRYWGGGGSPAATKTVSGPVSLLVTIDNNQPEAEVVPFNYWSVVDLETSVVGFRGFGFLLAMVAVGVAVGVMTKFPDWLDDKRRWGDNEGLIFGGVGIVATVGLFVGAGLLLRQSAATSIELDGKLGEAYTLIEAGLEENYGDAQVTLDVGDTAAARTRWIANALQVDDTSGSPAVVDEGEGPTLQNVTLIDGAPILTAHTTPRA